MFWILYLTDCLPPFWLVLFLEFCSVLFFHLGHVPFSPNFGCLSAFVSIYYVDLLCFPVLTGWTDLVGVLWGPWYNLPDHLSWVLQEYPLCGLCVLVEPWLLLACQWVWLTLRVTGCENWPWVQHTSCCVGIEPMACVSPQQAVVPAKTTFLVCCL